MAGKKIKTLIKLNLPAGEATPAPPVGPALGQHGLPIMDFVKAYNEKTADMKGTVVPAVITVYENRTFSFVIKQSPIAEMIKKEITLEKGAAEAGRKTVGKLTQGQVRKIAEDKMPDLNTRNLEAAMRIVAGTARSMGVEIQE